MANSFIEFLCENPVDDVTYEFSLCERLKDYKFKVKPMNGADFDNYSRQCRKIGRRGKVDFDGVRYNMLVILNHVMEPDFRDVKAIQKAGVRTPEELVNKALMAGEISRLAEKISELSGFDADMDEMVEEVKNS